MSRGTLFLDEALYSYMLSVSLQEEPILAELRELTGQLPQAQMQISPEQGQLMSLLVRLMGAKKTLEIGTFTGYSALAVALALPAEGHLIACDINKEWTAIAQEFWAKAGVQNKISLYLAPAIETLDKLIAQGETGTFDFAFIDADKENYELYFEKSFQLTRSGGLIAIDNTFMHGRVMQPAPKDVPGNAIRKFNEQLFHDKRVRISFLPIGDGLTLALKK